MCKVCQLVVEEKADQLLCFGCVVHVAVCVPCLFLAVPLVGLQSVIVAFPGHTHLPFAPNINQ